MRVKATPESLLERLSMIAEIAPTAVLETTMALAMARTIMAAASLGVFDALARSPATAEELAGQLDLDLAGTDALLVALHGLDYVEPDPRRRDQGAYRLGAVAEQFLVSSAPRSFAAYVGELTYDMWDWFSHLEEVVSGGPPIGLHGTPPGDPLWERYMRGLVQLARFNGEEIAHLIPVRRGARRMLDLAGGHGGYACAVLRRHSRLRATVLELEGAARIGSKLVEEQGFGDRVTYRVGDIVEDDLGDGWDLVTLFNIVHHLQPEENQRVMDRARAALGPGGTVAVFEAVRPEPGERPSQVGALTGLLFFVTSRARTYSAQEICNWLARAGFKRIRRHQVRRAAGQVLVSARA